MYWCETKLLPSKLDAYIRSAKTYCFAISKSGLVSEYGAYAYCGCLIGHGPPIPCPQPTCSLLKPFIRQFVPGMLPVPLHAAKNAPEP
jgi:hypothetical protein